MNQSQQCGEMSEKALRRLQRRNAIIYDIKHPFARGCTPVQRFAEWVLMSAAGLGSLLGLASRGGCREKPLALFAKSAKIGMVLMIAAGCSMVVAGQETVRRIDYEALLDGIATNENNRWVQWATVEGLDDKALRADMVRNGEIEKARRAATLRRAFEEERRNDEREQRAKKRSYFKQ